MFLSYLTYIYFFVLSFLPLNTWSQGFRGQPVSFMPNMVSTDAEKTVSNIVFRKLVNVNPFTGEIKYDLLKKYEIKEDGLVYEVELKKNQFWQDGSPITADDLLYTASLSSNLKEISSDKVDEYKVRFILPNKYSPFSSILALQIMPLHLQDSANPIIPIGSGDFRIVRVKKDRAVVKEVVLVTTEDAYKFKKLVFRFYDSKDDLVVATKIREVDSVFSNSPQKFDGYNSREYVFYGRSYLLVFNIEKDYLDTADRRNFAKSLDYSKILENQEYTAGQIPHGPMSNTWADSEFYEKIEFDPSFKFKLGSDKELNFVVPEIEEAKLIASNVKQQIESKNIAKVSVQTLPTEDYVVKARDHDYDIILLAHEYGLDPDRYVFWHSTQNKTGLNFSNFSTVRLDKSLEEGREELDIEKRKNHYNIFQTAFSEEAPALFLLHPAQYFYYSNKIEGLPNKKVFYPWQVFDDFKDWKIKQPKVVF